MMPRSASAMTMSRFSGQTAMPPSLKVPFQKVSSRSHTRSLKGIPGGTYVPDETKCYDDAEIEQLAQLLKRLIWAPSQVRKKLQQAGVTIVPCSFYSEIPSLEDIERSFELPAPSYDLIFDDHVMKEGLAELHRFSPEFDPPRVASEKGSYAWEGNPFSFSDAMAYYCMIRRYRPATIVEVGSGWSTLVADM